jgi:hypothetical protein
VKNFSFLPGVLALWAEQGRKEKFFTAASVIPLPKNSKNH